MRASIVVGLVTTVLAAGNPPPRDLAPAIRDSLRYLEADGDRWLEGEVSFQDGRGCVSCHHVGYALWTHREARRAGVCFPTEAIDDLRRRTVEFLSDPDKPRVVSATQMIMAEAHGKGDLAQIRSASKPDGDWAARGQFPTQLRSEEESDAAMSLWALAALATLEPLDGELATRRDRALEWLARAEPGVSNEWTAARLVVAFLHHDHDRVTTLLDRLLAEQNEDGGWSWIEDAPSNPFSTGQTLYALATVGDERAGEALLRGAGFLLDRQEDDGTWDTPSRLLSSKPSEGKDYVYRYWGTAWASLGLSRTLALQGDREDCGRAPGRRASTGTR